MSVEEKRQRIDALRAQVEERKREHAVKTAEATESVREARLDNEIERLERELAALSDVPEPTGELSEPEVPVRLEHDINLSGEAGKPELVEMALSLGIEQPQKMLKDDLIDAIRERSGVVEEEGSH